MNRPGFAPGQELTSEDMVRRGIQPEELFQEVEGLAIAERIAGDWLLQLFFPLGIQEMLEGECLALMYFLKQPYSDIMSMPSSRRRRMLVRMKEVGSRIKNPE